MTQHTRPLGERRCLECDATLRACNLARATGAGKCCPDCKHPAPWETCHQVGCHALAAARFYWPGREPLAACPAHTNAAMRIANAMGFPLHLEAIFHDEEKEGTSPELGQ